MMLHLETDHSLRSATPHTPNGVVVEQKRRSTCSALLHPERGGGANPSTVLFAGERGAPRSASSSALIPARTAPLRRSTKAVISSMSSTSEANGRNGTNAPLFAGILARAYARIAFCEFVGARPTDAKAAAFTFGRTRGVIEGCAGALGLPMVFLTSPTWKRLADIPPGAENKDLARTRAIVRWPARADLFARKCDVDRAEAYLIALAGLKREPRQ
jgi:crossover junction endodeoxyribonuclease RuvC